MSSSFSVGFPQFPKLPTEIQSLVSRYTPGSLQGASKAAQAIYLSSQNQGQILTNFKQVFGEKLVEEILACDEEYQRALQCTLPFSREFYEVSAISRYVLEVLKKGGSGFLLEEERGLSFSAVQAIQRHCDATAEAHALIELYNAIRKKLIQAHPDTVPPDFQGDLTLIREWFAMEENPFLELVTEIDLSRKKIMAIPGELSRLVNLRSLTINNAAHFKSMPIFKVIERTAEETRESSPEELKHTMELIRSGLPRPYKIRHLPISIGIGNLTNLTTLNLEGNKLYEFPLFIEQLTALTSLSLEIDPDQVIPDPINWPENLSRLKILGPLRTLPSGLETLLNLRVLDFAENQIESIPASGFPLFLRELYLQNNRISAVPVETGLPPLLELLLLGNNPIEEPPLEIAKTGGVLYKGGNLFMIYRNNLHTQ